MYFTVAEVNAILPDVIKKFEMAMAKKKNVANIQAMVERTSMGSLDDLVRLRQKLNAAVVEFYEAIKTLEDTGAVIKGLDQGLLDFASKRFDEDVWLCWKYGETKIGFWHEKDIGFMGRKPLASDDISLV